MRECAVIDAIQPIGSQHPKHRQNTIELCAQDMNISIQMRKKSVRSQL
jgi:hypothetical protein